VCAFLIRIRVSTAPTDYVIGAVNDFDRTLESTTSSVCSARPDMKDRIYSGPPSSNPAELRFVKPAGIVTTVAPETQPTPW
jgi:hypothetical protein